MLTLNQRQFPFGRRQYSLSEEPAVSIRTSGLFASQELAIPFERFSPNVVRTRFIPWRWGLFAGLWIALAAALLVPAFTDSNLIGTDRTGLLVGGCTLAALAALCVVALLRGSHNLVIFPDARTGVALLVMRAASPTEAEAQAFVTELIHRIQLIRYPSALSPEQRAELHRKHLEFLLAETVLTIEEYDRLLKRVNDSVRPAEVVRIIK